MVTPGNLEAEVPSRRAVELEPGANAWARREAFAEGICTKAVDKDGVAKATPSAGTEEGCAPVPVKRGGVVVEELTCPAAET